MFYNLVRETNFDVGYCFTPLIICLVSEKKQKKPKYRGALLFSRSRTVYDTNYIIFFIVFTIKRQTFEAFRF